MLFGKRTQANVVALVSLSTLLLPAALAADNPYPILVPCGSGSTNRHAIVPDASGCQQISDTGAFSIANLPTLEAGVRIGFSATADCKATYTPPYEELVKLQQSQNCTIYTMSQAGSKPGNPGGKLLQDGHGPAMDTEVELAEEHPDAYAKQADADSSQQKDGVQNGGTKLSRRSPEQETELIDPDPAADVMAGVDGFYKKRGYGGLAPKKGGLVTEPASDSLPVGQMALSYVMLVNA